MVTATATKASAVAPTPAPTPSVFELDEAALAILEPRGGRQELPSKYTEELKQAAESKKAMGIPVTATVKAAYVMGQLRKGARQLNLKVKIWDRSETVNSKTGPFIGFQVLGPADPPAAETQNAQNAQATTAAQ